MFDQLTNKLSTILQKLTDRGSLNEKDVNETLQQIRIALLEADVSLSVVKEFLEKAKKKSVGSKLIKSVSPGQLVVKIVNDTLIEILGHKEDPINLKATPPVIILMVGLQGSGKTTTSAKIAKRLKIKDKKKVLMSSLDVQRPAAQEQLATLGKQVEVNTVDIVPKQTPLEIAKRSLDQARKEGYDVLILDTAGRLQIDKELMGEVESVSKLTNPTEILLVSDAMIGQESVNVAEAFHSRIGLTGLVLSKMDGDARGGAALSITSVTGIPVKFIGLGERVDALEQFHPDRLASRILGMGDILTLVERAEKAIGERDATRLAEKLRHQEFSLEDLRNQVDTVSNMGSLEQMIEMIPGLRRMNNSRSDGDMDQGQLVRTAAIIDSMTVVERRNPAVINGSRRKRIACGSGTEVQDVNRLLKQFSQMRKMLKMVKGVNVKRKRAGARRLGRIGFPQSIGR